MNAVPLDEWEGRPLGEWRREWRVPAVLAFERIGSTNDAARELAEQGGEAGATVVADVQTAGRGQAGRPWLAPPGLGLLASVLFRGESGTDPSVMPLRIGLAVARAVHAVTGLDVSLKWPNDLVLDGRKLGGILCEAASSPSAWVIAGIGLNVGQGRSDFPPELRAGATSLRIAGATNANRGALLGAILDRLRPFRLLPPPLDPVSLRELNARDALRGRSVSIDDVPAGTADGIAPDGTLLIREDGRVRAVRTGTVRLDARDAGDDARHTITPSPLRP